MRHHLERTASDGHGNAGCSDPHKNGTTKLSLEAVDVYEQTDEEQVPGWVAELLSC